MAAGAQFAVLGPLEFRRHDTLVSVPNGMPRSVLAILLMHAGEPLSRDRLIDELWGERPPSTVASSLQVLSRACDDRLTDGLLEEQRALALLARTDADRAAGQAAELERLAEQHAVDERTTRRLMLACTARAGRPTRWLRSSGSESGWTTSSGCGLGLTCAGCSWRC
jgi:DNA-binding SARP family transcriptional activator